MFFENLGYVDKPFCCSYCDVFVQMKEFRSQQGFQSAPLSANGEPKENPEVKWVSQGMSIDHFSLSLVSTKKKKKIDQNLRAQTFPYV